MFNKFCQWLDSNCRPLVSEATALPTEPQPLPHLWKFPKSRRRQILTVHFPSSPSPLFCLFLTSVWQTISSLNIRPTTNKIDLPSTAFFIFLICSNFQMFESKQIPRSNMKSSFLSLIRFTKLSQFVNAIDIVSGSLVQTSRSRSRLLQNWKGLQQQFRVRKFPISLCRNATYYRRSQ